MLRVRRVFDNGSGSFGHAQNTPVILSQLFLWTCPIFLLPSSIAPRLPLCCLPLILLPTPPPTPSAICIQDTSRCNQDTPKGQSPMRDNAQQASQRFDVFCPQNIIRRMFQYLGPPPCGGDVLVIHLIGPRQMKVAFVWPGEIILLLLAVFSTAKCKYWKASSVWPNRR